MLRGLFRKFDRGEIDFFPPVLQAELAQNSACGAECVGLNYVTPDAEEVSVNITNDVRTAQNENFAAVLLSPIIIQSGVALLDIGAHRPVVDDDAFAHGLEKRSH